MNQVGIHQLLHNEQTQISNLNLCQTLLSKINAKCISKHPSRVSLLFLHPPPADQTPSSSIVPGLPPSTTHSSFHVMSPVLPFESHFPLWSKFLGQVSNRFERT